MVGFKKPKSEQAALKVGMYGPSGSGKTFTALLFAEGLSRETGKKVALIDTENGADFYCQNVPDRKMHPGAFEFDVLKTKSICEILEAIPTLGADYGVLVVDSITHIWEACRNAYAGKVTAAGTIPFHAWAKIKKPYKDLINMLLSSPMHIFICGRQGNVFEEDENSGELKMVGYKMKSEGETPYEPHILLRMEAVRNLKKGEAIITVFAEKDRTGILAGRTIEWPTFDNVIKPLLPLLGGTQARIASDDETSAKDAESLTQAENQRIIESEKILHRFRARFDIAESAKDVDAIAKEVTPELKKKMTTADVAELREAFLEASRRYGK